MDKTLFQRWFGKAQPVAETTQALADRGVADAQFALGLNFANGVGRAADFAQAAFWYLKAAAQSHSLAQFNLGLMYAAGQGLPCDPAQSRRWMQSAADLGDAGAQFNLGQTHQRASLRGTPVEIAAERVQAYQWFRLSADQGYVGSERACEAINLKMSREEVTAGQQRVVAFHATKALTA